jgi:hypothetical protein
MHAAVLVQEGLGIAVPFCSRCAKAELSGHPLDGSASGGCISIGSGNAIPVLESKVAWVVGRIRYRSATVQAAVAADRFARIVGILEGDSAARLRRLNGNPLGGRSQARHLE